jgi:hypothetical protein
MGSDVIWLGLVGLPILALLGFLVFSRGARYARRSTEATDLRRAGDGVDRDSPGESPASYWPNS